LAVFDSLDARILGFMVAIDGGFWDEVKGIILERVRHGAPKQIERGECMQVVLTEVFTFWS
jgi:hypothetical protein